MDRHKFADRIVETCISKFNSLGKSGKPQENTEWALLACFVKEEFSTEALEVVALGTGSKCIGAKDLPKNGVVLHDSHAEVIARRAFKLYLIDQMKKSKEGQSSIFEQKEERYSLKSEYRFHFYASHTPCGDASIFPKQEWQENVGENLDSIKDKYLLGNKKTPNLEDDSSSDTEGYSNIIKNQTTPKNILSEEVYFNISKTKRTGSATDIPADDAVVIRQPNIYKHKSSLWNSKIKEVSGFKIKVTESETVNLKEGAVVKNEPQMCENGPPLKKIKTEQETCTISKTRGTESAINIPKDGADVITKEPLDESTVQDKSAACLLYADKSKDNNESVNGIKDTLGTSKKQEKHAVISADQTGTCIGPFITDMDIKSDIYRTGAKCVSGEKSDPKLPGSDYHITGVLRTKPGRGNPTLSLSCSDKIFKWTVLGVQGSLLMLLLNAPIYIETITVGECPYSQEAMERAVFRRYEEKLKEIHLPSGFQIVTPTVLHSAIDFPFSRMSVSRNASNLSKVKPSPTSVIWSNSTTHRDKHEVATKGRKLGSTGLNINKPSSWVSICRKGILRQIVGLIQNQTSLTGGKDPCKLSYEDLQCLAVSYKQAWESLKKNVLMNWTVKPAHMKNFNF